MLLAEEDNTTSDTADSIMDDYEMFSLLSYDEQLELLFNSSPNSESDFDFPGWSKNSSEVDNPHPLINSIFSFVDDADPTAQGPSTMTCALIVLYTVSFLTGLVGNFTALAVVFKCRHLNQTTSVLLFSLLTSDLLVVTFCLPFTMVSHVNGSLIHGKVMCKLLPFVQGTTLFSGMFMLFVLTAQQFSGRQGADSNNYVMFQRLFCGYGTGIIVALCWVSAVLLSSPLLYVTELRVMELMGLMRVTMCQEIWPQVYSRHLYNFVIFMLTYVVPGIILGVSFIRRICRKPGPPLGVATTLNKENNNQLEHSGGRNPNDDNRIQLEILSSVSQHSIMIRSPGDQNARRLLGWMVAIFALLWLPYHIIIIYLDVYAENDSVTNLGTNVFPIAQWLALSTSAFRPVFYCLLATDFRAQLSRGCCLCRSATTDDDHIIDSRDEGLFMQNGHFEAYRMTTESPVVVVENGLNAMELEEQELNDDNVMDVVTVV